MTDALRQVLRRFDVIRYDVDLHGIVMSEEEAAQEIELDLAELGWYLTRPTTTSGPSATRGTRDEVRSMRYDYQYLDDPKPTPRPPAPTTGRRPAT